MKTRFRIATSGATLLFIGAAFVHPFGRAKEQSPAKPSLTDSITDAEAARIVRASCQNCHSERTDWPWYSYVPPMSWMVEQDVNTARSHMNFSRWNEYSADEKQQYLSKMSFLVKRRAMPLPRYLKLHPEARLTDEQVAYLSQWARREAKRVSDAAPQAGGQ
jgi:heme-binding protein